MKWRQYNTDFTVVAVLAAGIVAALALGELIFLALMRTNF